MEECGQPDDGGKGVVEWTGACVCLASASSRRAKGKETGEWGQAVSSEQPWGPASVTSECAWPTAHRTTGHLAELQLSHRVTMKTV